MLSRFKYHYNRRACRKHSIKSIPIITPNVILSHRTQPTINTIILPVTIPPPIVFSKNTLASYPCANESAQRRRYEAVFEIDPLNFNIKITKYKFNSFDNLMNKNFAKFKLFMTVAVTT